MPDQIKEADFSQYRKECIQDVISVLKEALDKAERGLITSVAIAHTSPGGSAGTQVSKTDNVFALLGAIDLVHYRLISDLDK